MPPQRRLRGHFEDVAPVRTERGTIVTWSKVGGKVRTATRIQRIVPCLPEKGPSAAAKERLLDVPQLSLGESSTAEDAPDPTPPVAYICLVPPAKKVRRNPLVKWRDTHRRQYLDEMCRHDGRGDWANVCGKPGCLNPAGFRCIECHDLGLLCRACIIQVHVKHPLHLIEVSYSILRYLT
jgi:hypothetical protein